MLEEEYCTHHYTTMTHAHPKLRAAAIVVVYFRVFLSRAFAVNQPDSPIWSRNPSLLELQSRSFYSEWQHPSVTVRQRRYRRDTPVRRTPNGMASDERETRELEYE